MKKVLCFLLVVIFMMSLGSVAWADEGITDQKYAKVESLVEKANLKISDLVSKAVADADKIIMHYEEKVLEVEKLERLTQDLEEDIDKIIAKLLQHTNDIANKTIEAGKKEEIVVECSIIEVVIGGETVLVDPLRIRRY